MIVFGPVIFLFIFGIFCIFMDIYYSKDDEITKIEKPIVQNQPINWEAEYEDNSTYLDDDVDNYVED